jgi:TolB-like protein
MSLFEEIKRRKVFRVAAVYAATAFVVLQAADLALPRLGVPEWAMSLIVVLLALGFPVALVLAWALELTPDGVRVTRNATAGSENPAPPALLGGRTIAVVALLLAVGVGLGAGLLLAPRTTVEPGNVIGPGATPDGAASAAAPDRSVAVLPFADFSPDGDQEWFSDGLAEEILNALARLPDLRVASRTGSFQFRGHSGDVRAIADGLGVAHILEGSVRRAGDQVRITAQLIRASDDAHLWSQNFDRDATDVIRVQEEIAYEIARTLRTALDPEELARMVAAGTNSIAAHEALLRSRNLWNRAAELEDFNLLLEAHKAVEEARSLDPQFYMAHWVAAGFWLGQLRPVSMVRGVTDLSYAQLGARAREGLRAAEATAPDRLSRLRAEQTRAALELRLQDVLTLSQQIVEMTPTGNAWLELGIHAAQIGRYDLARDAYRDAAAREEDVRFGLIGVAEHYHRVDARAAQQLVDDWLAEQSAHLTQTYQAHRVLLAGGRVEEAASLAEKYLERSTSRSGMILVRIRQMCGEGRTADARAYDDSLADSPGWSASEGVSTRWLALNYLGRTDEATELLRPYDEAGELYPLSTFLDFTFFDPRPYPNLSATLRRHGALRAEPLPIPYACPPLVADRDIAERAADLRARLEGARRS